MARTILRKNLSAEIWKIMPLSVLTQSARAIFQLLVFTCVFDLLKQLKSMYSFMMAAA